MPFGTGGRFMNRPYAPKQKRRGRPPGRPTENLRFSETRPAGAGGTSRTPSPTENSGENHNSFDYPMEMGYYMIEIMTTRREKPWN